MGYSRQQFYKIRNFQTFGSQGLLDRLPPKEPHPNRLPKEIEDAILGYCLDFPPTAASVSPRSSPCARPTSPPAASAASGNVIIS